MTTFVDTSVLLTGQQAEDQDPVVVIVRSAQTMLREGLGESGSEIFEKKFAENYSSKNFSAIFDLLMGNAVVIFKKVAAAEDVDRVSKTAEGYFEVCLSLLSKLESVEDVVSRIDAFIATVTAEASVPLLRLKLLTTLFQTLSPKAQLRLVVVKGMAKFAVGDEKLSALVFALVRDCDKWIVDFDWELSEEEKMAVFTLIASIAVGSEKLRFLRLAANTPALVEALALAALRDDSAVHLDALVSVVGASGVAGECIKCMSTGDFEKVEKFVASNAKFFESQKISVESVLARSRVVALAKLAEASLAKRESAVALSVVAQNLKTNDATTVVLRAVQAGLLIGSVDEVAGCVRIAAVASVDASATIKADLKRVLAAI